MTKASMLTGASRQKLRSHSFAGGCLSSHGDDGSNSSTTSLEHPELDLGANAEGGNHCRQASAGLRRQSWRKFGTEELHGESESNVLCRYGQSCWRPNCRFRHSNEGARLKLVSSWWAAQQCGGERRAQPRSEEYEVNEQIRGTALVHADEAIKADKEVVLEAVRHDGYALSCAAAALKADKEVVLAAVHSNGHALQYADSSLKADKDVVLAAVRSLSPHKLLLHSELQTEGPVTLQQLQEKERCLTEDTNSFKKEISTKYVGTDAWKEANDQLDATIKTARDMVHTLRLEMNACRRESAEALATLRHNVTALEAKRSKQTSEAQRDVQASLEMATGQVENQLEELEINPLKMRFRTTLTGEETIGLREYVARMQPDQTCIYYITGDNFTAMATSVPVVTLSKIDIEVLLIASPAVGVAVRQHGEYQGKRFIHVQ